MPKPRYNDDPDVAAVPLSVDEAGWVVANPKSLKGSGHVEHFARRALATANSCVQMRINFDNELRRRTAAAAPGAATNLSPETAARFLSPEQLAGLFDRLSQDKLAQLQAQQHKTAETQQRALTTLEYAANALKTGQCTPDQAARVIENAMEALKVSHV